MNLEILQINSDPLQWDETLHGVFTGGDPQYAGAILSETRIAAASVAKTEEEGLRRFLYSFVENEPDACYGGNSYDLVELCDVLRQIENAVYLSMTGADSGQQHLKDAGSALTQMLLPAWLIKQLFEYPEGTPLVIRVDDMAACIPWELCYSPRYKLFLGRHLAVSRGVTTDFTLSRFKKPSMGVQTHVPISEVACMINPEGDPGLKDYALSLDDLISDLQERGMSGENPLKCDITSGDLQLAMAKPFFHYFGHIRFDSQIGSYILCSDSIKVDAKRTARVIERGVSPKLVFLNACRSDSVSVTQIKPGQSATQTSFVQQFYRRGALSVIGTRWEVDVKTAQAADKHFFALFKRLAMPIGEVMRQFRQSGANGWPCYVLYGDPRIHFTLSGAMLSPQSHGTQVVKPLPTSSDVSETSAESRLRVQTMSPSAVRKPSLITPQYIAVLVENSGYVQERREILEAMESFLQSVTMQAHKINASADPHGGGIACGIQVKGYSAPLDGVLARYDQPEIHRNWQAAFTSGQKRRLKNYSLSRILKEVYGEFKRIILQHYKHPLPAPIVVVCAASGSSSPQRDTSDAIRICKDLRQLMLPSHDEPEHIEGTTVKTAILGFAETAHDSYLSALSGTTEANGKWWRLGCKEEAKRFAENLCHYILNPSVEEPFARLGTECDV